MPYCRECGNMVNEGNAFCHECGAKLNSEAPKQDYYEPKSSYSYEPEVPQVSKRNAVLSFVFGLINTELAIFALLPYACLFFFPACLIFSILGIKKANQYVAVGGPTNAFAIIGKILSIVTLVLTCVFFILGIVMTFVPGMAAEFYEAFFSTYGFMFDFGDLGDLGGSGSGGGTIF